MGNLRQMEDYFSWRNWEIQKILNRCANQKVDCCWAIGLVRQLESLLKLNDELQDNLSLSFQELINLVPKRGGRRHCHRRALKRGGSIRKTWIALDILHRKGTVLSSIVKTTYSLREPPTKKIAFRYKPHTVDMIEAYTFSDSYEFEKLLLKELRTAPVAVEVPMCEPYYKEAYTNDSIYCPPLEAIHKSLVFHVMLVTGFLIENGTQFWELQDSYGEDVVGKGFVKVAYGQGVILSYVKMRLEGDESGSSSDEAEVIQT